MKYAQLCKMVVEISATTFDVRPSRTNGSVMTLAVAALCGWNSQAWSIRPRTAGRLYRLTSDGRKQLAAETAVWRQFSAGVSKILLAR